MNTNSHATGSVHPLLAYSAQSRTLLYAGRAVKAIWWPGRDIPPTGPGLSGMDGITNANAKIRMGGSK